MPIELQKPQMPFLAKLMFVLAWGIVIIACWASAWGGIDISGTLAEEIIFPDVFAAWALGAGVMWLLVEPAALVLLFLGGLALKLLTSFENILDKESGTVKLEGGAPRRTGFFGKKKPSATSDTSVVPTTKKMQSPRSFTA